MRARLLLVAALAQAACHSAIRDAFQATYAEVTAPPPALPAAWEPDVSLRVSPAVVEGAVLAAIAGSDLKTFIDLPVIDIEPKVRVEQIHLVDPFVTCQGCVGVIGTFVGEVSFHTFGHTGRTKVLSAVTLDTRIDVVPSSDGWVVMASPPRVHAVDTRLPMLGAGQLVDLIVNPLTGWITDLLAKKLPPITLAHLGNLEVPLQALRVEMRDDILEVQARTFSRAVSFVEPAPAPTSGWTVRMPVASVVELARAILFERGSLGGGIWADPRDIDVEDDRFRLSLRLWRVGRGLGWWRDYRVEGDVVLDGGHLRLAATDVDEVAHSEGAGLADPIAALAKGRILDLIAEALTTQVPTSRTQDIRGTQTTFEVRALQREGEDLVLWGDATFAAGL